MYILAPVIVYPVLAALLPVIFYFISRRHMWLSILVAIIVDLMLYWSDFSYYEARPIMVVFTLAQIFAMAIIIWLLKHFSCRKTD